MEVRKNATNSAIFLDSKMKSKNFIIPLMSINISELQKVFSRRDWTLVRNCNKIT